MRPSTKELGVSGVAVLRGNGDGEALLLLLLLLRSCCCWFCCWLRLRLPTTPRKGTSTTARAGVTAEVPAEEAGMAGALPVLVLSLFSFAAAAAFAFAEAAFLFLAAADLRAAAAARRALGGRPFPLLLLLLA